MGKPSTNTSNSDAGFEVSDIKVNLVVYSAIATVLAIIGSIAVSFMFTKFLVSDSREYISSDDYVHIKPGENDWTDPIRLQMTPGVDMEKHRGDSTTALNSYGIVDDASSTYRIPIDEAIKLVAEKGTLPTHKAAGH